MTKILSGQELLTPILPATSHSHSPFRTMWSKALSHTVYIPHPTPTYTKNSRYVSCVLYVYYTLYRLERIQRPSTMLNLPFCNDQMHHVIEVGCNLESCQSIHIINIITIMKHKFQKQGKLYLTQTTANEKNSTDPPGFEPGTFSLLL